jgi:hypothetical protein
MSTDTILRAADPLAGRDADLDPRGAMAARIRAGALAAPATTPAHRNAHPRRLALAAVAALALAAALAVALPGGRPTPPGARAALVSAAERTASFTSGHIVWRMTYDKPALDLTNDVRFDGSDFANAMTSRFLDSGRVSHVEIRIVGGRQYDRTDDGAFTERPGDPDARDGVTARLQAADALADAARAAADVRAEPAGDDGATRYTATVAAADVPDAFRPPSPRAAPTVTIVAVAAGDTLRSLQLRTPGEAVDITFDGLGQPQGIVAP